MTAVPMAGGEGQGQSGAVSPPPKLSNMTPEMAFEIAIDDLYQEAAHWLDGEPLANAEQADVVGRIMTGLRKIRKDADAARADEKRPHDDAGRAVQAKWKPLLEKADRAITAAQKPITDWLAKQEAERLIREREARAEADRLAREAVALQARNTLADAEAHDAAIKAAQQAERAVGRIAKDTAKVAGEGRAVSRRTYHDTELTDAPAALRWLREHRPTELRAAVLELVKAEPLAMRRAIPGVAIIERKAAA